MPRDFARIIAPPDAHSAMSSCGGSRTAYDTARTATNVRHRVMRGRSRWQTSRIARSPYLVSATYSPVCMVASTARTMISSSGMKPPQVKGRRTPSTMDVD